MITYGMIANVGHYFASDICVGKLTSSRLQLLSISCITRQQQYTATAKTYVGDSRSMAQQHQMKLCCNVMIKDASADDNLMVGRGLSAEIFVCNFEYHDLALWSIVGVSWEFAWVSLWNDASVSIIYALARKIRSKMVLLTYSGLIKATGHVTSLMFCQTRISEETVLNMDLSKLPSKHWD
jgi:hypothetical protein